MRCRRGSVGAAALVLDIVSADRRQVRHSFHAFPNQAIARVAGRNSCRLFTFVVLTEFALRAEWCDVDCAPIENSAGDPVAPVGVRPKPTHEWHEGLTTALGSATMELYPVPSPAAWKRGNGRVPQSAAAASTACSDFVSAIPLVAASIACSDFVPAIPLVAASIVRSDFVSAIPLVGMTRPRKLANTSPARPAISQRLNSKSWQNCSHTSW